MNNCKPPSAPPCMSLLPSGKRAAERYGGPSAWPSPLNITLAPEHGCDLFVLESHGLQRSIRLSGQEGRQPPGSRTAPGTGSVSQQGLIVAVAQHRARPTREGDIAASARRRFEGKPKINIKMENKDNVNYAYVKPCVNIKTKLSQPTPPDTITSSL